jgi:hypothetical protein
VAAQAQRFAILEPTANADQAIIGPPAAHSGNIHAPARETGAIIAS